MRYYIKTTHIVEEMDDVNSTDIKKLSDILFMITLNLVTYYLQWKQLSLGEVL